MKTIFIFQLISLFLAGGCGTVVGNPGGKKKEDARQDVVLISDKANDETPKDEIVVSEGTIVTSSNTVNAPITFDPASIMACVTESPTSGVSAFSKTEVHFSIDAVITATDVKFYFYNNTSMVERNPLYPIEEGTYRVYALSYSLKRGCFIDVAISADQLLQKPKITYKLTSF